MYSVNVLADPDKDQRQVACGWAAALIYMDFSAETLTWLAHIQFKPPRLKGSRRIRGERM